MYFFRYGFGQQVQVQPGLGGDADGVGKNRLHGIEYRTVSDVVRFIQQDQRFFLIAAEFFQYRFNTFDLLECLGTGGIDDVQQQVSIDGFLPAWP